MAYESRLELERGIKDSSQQLANLRKKWPQAFPAKDEDVRPLSIHADDEIAAAMDWSKSYTIGVLSEWEMTHAYCRAIIAHDRRIGLNGTPAEEVDGEAKDLATKRLEQLAQSDRTFALEERRVALEERKAAVDTELRRRESSWLSRFFSPLTSTLAAGILTLAGSVAATILQGTQTLELESKKFESVSLVLSRQDRIWSFSLKVDLLLRKRPTLSSSP